MITNTQILAYLQITYWKQKFVTRYFSLNPPYYCPEKYYRWKQESPRYQSRYQAGLFLAPWLAPISRTYPMSSLFLTRRSTRCGWVKILLLPIIIAALDEWVVRYTLKRFFILWISHNAYCIPDWVSRKNGLDEEEKEEIPDNVGTKK